ncbi:MAG: sigma-70 family RNA polymerase sigma factor [Chloroflexota bacterium]
MRTPVGQESDATLVEAARRGDQAAFAALIERHRPSLLMLCRRLLRHPVLADEAEDVAQDAALQALLSLPALRQPEHFGAWLRGIGLHLCQRRLRERTRPADSWEALLASRRGRLVPAAMPGPEEAAERWELGRVLLDAIEELPVGQRDAVRLFYLGNCTYEETGATLGICTGAVKTRLHKARSTLQRRFWAPLSAAATAVSDRSGFAAVPAEVRAIHEAGHAVMAHLHGVSIHRVSIDLPAPHGAAHPARPSPALRASRPEMPSPLPPSPPAAQMAMILAGEAAHFLRSGRRQAIDGSDDRARAGRVARDAAAGDDVEAALILEQQWTRTRERLDQPQAWARVERLAAALLERRTIEGDRLNALVAGAPS